MRYGSRDADPHFPRAAPSAAPGRSSRVHLVWPDSPQWSKRSPVLLVAAGSIPEATDAELRRLKPEVITIAGGTRPVSAAVQDQLAAYDIR
jgi:hypothetical protein